MVRSLDSLPFVILSEAKDLLFPCIQWPTALAATLAE